MRTNTKSTGKFKVGFVKKTNGQQKKHISQMDELEVSTILRRVKRIPNLFLSDHAVRKIKQDGLKFSYDQIVDLLLNVSEENIIEYNRTTRYGKEEQRVLLRSTVSYPVDIKGVGVVDCNICYVLSLNTGSIVTAYWNQDSDAHETIIWSRYDATLEVV